MHFGEPHTIRSHKISEINELINKSTRIQTVISGTIVYAEEDTDEIGKIRRIIIADSLGNYYVLPGILMIGPVGSMLNLDALDSLTAEARYCGSQD